MSTIARDQARTDASLEIDRCYFGLHSELLLCKSSWASKGFKQKFNRTLETAITHITLCLATIKIKI